MSNDFLPFANGAGANVATAADYSANSGYVLGYQSGVAQSKYLNRTWRQSSLMAAAVGQFISDNGANATDDGVVTNLEAALTTALSNFIKNSSLFSASKTNNGYQKFPNGIIQQWGSMTTDSNGNAAVVFPIAFPTACLNIEATIAMSSTGNSASAGASAPTPTGVTLNARQTINGSPFTGAGIFWFATGY